MKALLSAWIPPHFRNAALLLKKRMFPAPRRNRRPDGQFSRLPAAIRNVLIEIRRRLVLQSLASGAARFVVAAVLVLSIQMFWDWLVHLPLVVRTLFLAGDLVAACFFGWMLFGLPLRDQPSLEDCALYLERRFGHLRSTVISAVQFSLEAPDPLRQSVQTKAVELVASIHPGEVVSSAPVRKPLRVAAMVVGLALVFLFLTWPTSSVLLARLALSNRAIPAETFLLSVSGDLQVEPGESLMIEAKAGGVLPKSGRIEITRQDSSKVSRPLKPSSADPSLFSASIPNVQEAFSYRVVIKGAASPEHRVSVFRSPAVSSVELTRLDPPYTRNPPLRLDKSALAVLAGGVIQIEGESTQSLRSARVEYRNGMSHPLKVDGKKFSGDLPVPSTAVDGFSILLENTSGIPSRNNTLHRLRVIRDEPPRIAWKPGLPDRRTIVAETKPRLAFSVADNFLVTEAWLVAAVEKEGNKREEMRIPLNIPEPATGYDFDEIIDEPGRHLPWKSGTTVTYWIEASDNNTATGPGIGKSPVREWVIVSKDRKREEIYEQLDQTARRIKQVSDNQKNLRQTTQDLQKP